MLVEQLYSAKLLLMVLNISLLQAAVAVVAVIVREAAVRAGIELQQVLLLRV